MASYTTMCGHEVEFDALDETRYWAVQALLSQRCMSIDDRPGGDKNDQKENRRFAVDEWSAAVRNGFVCC